MKLPFSRTIANYLKLLSYKSDGWQFSKERKWMFVIDYKEWLKFYLPISVKGLTVLDVGAGDGETARFFLEQGAKKIVAIEPDDACFRHLKENSLQFPIFCLHKKFDLEDLRIPHDFLKVDIEGYEEALLSVTLDKPAVVEVHGLQLRDRFREKGYKIEYPNEDCRNGASYLCYAYAYRSMESGK